MYFILLFVMCLNVHVYQIHRKPDGAKLFCWKYIFSIQGNSALTNDSQAYALKPNSDLHSSPFYVAFSSLSDSYYTLCGSVSSELERPYKMFILCKRMGF